jgi:hypothetical protein
MSKFLIFCFLLGNVLLRADAAAVNHGGAELLNPKAYAIRLQASAFSTLSHYEADGTEIEVSPDGHYRLIDTDFKISYGISSNFESSVLVRGRSVDSSNGVDNAKNSGIESAGFEAKYAFAPINSLHYAIGLRYRQTLYTNTHYTSSQTKPTNEVILGDDGSEYGVDFYATYLTSQSWKWDFLIGYNSPPNELSSEILFKSEVQYVFTRLGFFLGLEAIHSLKKDQYTDNPSLKPIMTSGETALFNGINRENFAPYAGLNYAFDKFLFFLRGQSVMAGKSTDKGNTIALGFSWNSVGVTSESAKIASFKEYHIDGSVLKVSARGNFIKIDQGLSTDVEKGTKFDIYQTDYFGGNILVAAGIAHEIGSDWAVIKVLKKYKNIDIKPGFAARGY